MDAWLAEPDPRPEVQRHLDVCPRCRVHRRLLRQSETRPPTPPPTATDEDDLGTPMDPDGTGPRWLVWDPELGRLVTHVQPEGGDSAWFAGRIEVLRTLAHPHVAAIHRMSGAEPLRYVRDRLPGTHLGRMDVASDPRAGAWLAQAASGLAYLHHRGICHGRLRPTSLRITPEGQVLLVDIALVEAHDEREDWRALCALFEDLPGRLGERVRAIGETTGEGASGGSELMSWLLAMRDPGAGGGPRYQPRGLLGVGGMGEVRSVYDPLLERVVAQKVLSAELVLDGDRIQRFLDEVHITAQLQHPGVVPVHDLEHLSDGAVAFTMKQLDGRTMAQVVRDVHAVSIRRWTETPSGWSLRRLVEALRRVCDAVAYAHASGVVHLDLKPGNIMLGDYGEVLVFDWGLAQRLEDGVAVLPRPAGTPAYMAPEQREAGPDGVVVGPTADVYGIGVILIEILDGAPPDDVASWTPARADAPRELVSIVRRATHADPAERYPSATAMARDILHWKDDRPVGAHAYSMRERVWRRVRPHQAPIAVSVIAAVVLLAIGAVALERVEGERVKSDGMLAQALVDRANLAWDAHDLIQAEAFASAAVGIAGRADARGLLARLARGWRPQLTARWPHRCEELASHTAGLACATASEVVGWGLEPGAPEWRVPGRLARLERSLDGSLLAVTEGATVRLDSSERPRVLTTAPRDLAGSTLLDHQVLIRAGGPTVERLVDEQGLYQVERSLSLDHTVRELVRCGSSRIAVATDAGRLFLLAGDLQDAPRPIEADRMTGPIACTHDGRLAAIVSGRDIQVWALDPPVQKHILMGHLGDVLALDFSPDGRLLGTASRDGTVRLWDVRRGEEIVRLPGHDGARDLAFTLDGRAIATATEDGVRLWTLPEQPAAGTFDVVVQVQGLHWADDGSLFTLDRLGRPAGFDPQTGLQTLPVFLRVSDFDTAPAGERIAFGTREGDFGVLDLDENAFVLRIPTAHAGGTTAVAWQPGGEVAVSAGRAGAIHAWSTAAGAATTPIWSRGLGAPVAGVSWSGDGQLVAARTDEGLVVLRGADGDEVLRLPGDIRTHALGPHGELVALAWERGGMVLGHLGTSPSFASLEVEGQVVGLSFSSTDPLLAAVTREGLLQVFDTGTHSERGRQFAHPGGATATTFSPDGSTLASSGARGEVVLFESAPLLLDAATLERDIAARYGVTRHGTELEFR